MSDETVRSCVLIPCSKTETWAVPQICLAEIYTLSNADTQPPASIAWRDHEVPVLDRGSDDGSTWRDERQGSGLIAIFLGLEGEACRYWGVAVRGDSLSMAKVAMDSVQDVPDAKLEDATAAFELDGMLLQVPDLDGLQKKVSCSVQMAH